VLKIIIKVFNKKDQDEFITIGVTNKHAFGFGMSWMRWFHPSNCPFYDNANSWNNEVITEDSVKHALTQQFIQVLFPMGASTKSD